MEYQYLETDHQQNIFTIWLNNPEKRNAFNVRMLIELSDAFGKINEMTEDVVILIRGRGKAFCAGADLGWMQHAIHLDPKINYEECKHLSDCLLNIYQCKKITIAVVHGAAYGGGLGLLAACDISLCTDDTKFALSELKLGLVASCICPFIVKKLGGNRTKELVFTGRMFEGKQAESYGLVNQSVPFKDLESVVTGYVSLVLSGAPEARAISKQLIHQVVDGKVDVYSTEYTARLLAEVRISAEARERLRDYTTK